MNIDKIITASDDEVRELSDASIKSFEKKDQEERILKKQEESARQRSELQKAEEESQASDRSELQDLESIFDTL